jgi:hypothetical protein
MELTTPLLLPVNKMKKLVFILIASLILSCNLFYKTVTGFRNPKLHETADIISFAENHGLTQGAQYMVNGDDYLKEFEAINFVSPGTYFLLFDSLGNFTKITPDNSTSRTLERIKVSDLPAFYRKFETQAALIDSSHRSAWLDYYNTQHVDSFLKKIISIKPISEDRIVLTSRKKDFTLIIPWAIFMGKKDQLKAIHSYLSGIKKNQHSTFNIIFINYDARKDCKNGAEFVKNFSLTMQKSSSN